jgi:hypothetical protein
MATAQQIRSAIDVASLDEFGATSAGPLYLSEVGANDAEATWKRWREPLRSLGCWPVIHGTRKDASNLHALIDSTKRVSAGRILDEAEHLEVAAALAARAAKKRETRAHGSWPKALVPANQFFLAVSGMRSKVPDPRTVIGIWPTADSTTIPAIIAFGGWNECPQASVHVALHRYWRERYGAELACLSRDIVQLATARRPATYDEALALATEQFRYCPDIVEQGTRTIENLASCLVESDVWFFWWD